jgi:hypothetical protein
MAALCEGGAVITSFLPLHIGLAPVVVVPHAANAPRLPAHSNSPKGLCLESTIPRATLTVAAADDGYAEVIIGVNG